METGESGVNGAHAQRHANKGSNQERVNVTHQLHNMVERNVKVNLWIQEFVTRKYHVQVTSKWSRLSIDVEYCNEGTHTINTSKFFCAFI